MNKERRLGLREIIEELSELRDRLDEVKDDEQAAYENLPDSLQGSERGQAMEEAVQNIEECVDSIEAALGPLEAVCGDA